MLPPPRLRVRARRAVLTGLASALALAAADLACSGETSASRHATRDENGVEETQAGGQKATADRSPARILSLAPSVTEILFAIGAGERVVGVDGFSDFPPEARELPALGGLLDPDLEGMLGLRPDLAVVLDSQRETARALRAAGIPTLIVPHETLDDVQRAIRTIGRRVGLAVRAERMADSLAAALARGRVHVPEASRPRVLFVVAREPGQVASFTAAGAGTYLDELIRLAGGRNVLAGSAVRYPQVSAESALLLRPDVILDWAPEETFDGRGRGVTGERPARDADWSRLPGLPAVQRGQVHVLEEDLWIRPGPRVVRALERLRDILADAR